MSGNKTRSIMSKIIFGALYVDARGQLGNKVASKNLSGPYFRNWIKTPNPNTTKQQNVRLLFSSITKSWSLLSNNSRTSWNNAIKKWPYHNVFGEEKLLTGHLLYNKLNLQAQNANFPPLTIAPKKTIMPEILLKSASFTDSPDSINLSLNFSSSIVNLIIYATPMLPSKAYSWKKTIRLISVFNSTTINPEILYNQYLQIFNPILANENIFIGIKKVMSNGQSAPIQVVKLIT